MSRLPSRYPRLLLATLLVGVLFPAAAKKNAEIYTESPGVAAHFPVPGDVNFTTPAFCSGQDRFLLLSKRWNSLFARWPPRRPPPGWRNRAIAGGTRCPAADFFRGRLYLAAVAREKRQADGADCRAAARQ